MPECGMFNILIRELFGAHSFLLLVLFILHANQAFATMDGERSAYCRGKVTPLAQQQHCARVSTNSKKERWPNPSFAWAKQQTTNTIYLVCSATMRQLRGLVGDVQEERYSFGHNET